MLSAEQWSVLKNSALFSGIKREEIRAFLAGAGIYPRMAACGDCLINQGEAQTDIYVLLSGAACGERLTADGRAFTVNNFQSGDIFGDVLSGAAEKSPVSVRMSATGEIIAIPFAALLHGANALIDVRERVLRNLINEIAQKYFVLLRRVELLAIPTLRGKIAAYLLSERKNGEYSFEISHSREEQARLLGCDRSALSRELSKLKGEGVIDFQRRRFEIIDLRRLEMLAQ